MVTILRIKKLYKSLSVRIFVVLLVFSVVPVYIMKEWIVDDYEKLMYEQREVKLQSQCVMLKNTVLSTDLTAPNSTEILDIEMSQLTSMYDGRVLLVDSEYRVIKDTYYLDEGKFAFSENVVKAFAGDKTIAKNYDNEYISITIPVNVETDTKNVSAVLVSVFSTQDISDMISELEGRAIIMMIIMYIIIISLAVGVVLLMTKPMKKMQSVIDKMATGSEDAQLLDDGYTYYELSGIAKAFNDNTARMQQLDNSRQEFVSNVAHELKTPITSIKVLADSLLCQEDIPAELYKEFLGDMVAEIDRESQIINDLLSLVRLDSGNESLKTEPKNINEILELILKRLKPIAAKKNIEVVFESYRPVVADIDEVKFTMAMQNFMENAIKYNVIDGWVRVSLNADYKYCYIKVSDSGIGIPEEDIPKIFERFYRVDKARSRETGGTGLGLAIANNIIKLHKGEVKVFSREGSGTTFNIRIPLNK